MACPLPYYCASQANIWGANAVQVVVTDDDIQAEIADITALAISSLTIEDSYIHFADACQILDENYVYLASWSSVAWVAFNNRIVNHSVDSNTGFWRVFDSWIAE